MPDQFQHMSLEEFAKLPSDTSTLVDIRDKASYTCAHIANAEHLSNDNLAEFIQNHEFTKPIIVYCYHGHSSQNAAQFLVEQGFEEVYSLIGGYTAWEAEYKR